MIDLPVWPYWLPVLAIVFAGSVFRGLSGFGYALVTAPILSTLLGPNESVPMIVAHEAFLTLLLVPRLRVEGASSLLTSLIAGMAVGTPIGVSLIFFIDPNFLTIGAAVAVLAFSFGLLVLKSQLWNLSTSKSVFSGFCSGVINGCTGMSGPPAVIYLLGSDLDHLTRRRVFMLFFLACSAVACVLFVATGLFTWSKALTAVMLLPVLIAGGYLGSFAVKRCGPQTLNTIALLVLAILSIASLIFGLRSLNVF